MYPQKLFERKILKQGSFNTYFAEVNHNGEKGWEARLIDQSNNVEELFGNMSQILFSKMD